jgi:hypothetical protein
MFLAVTDQYSYIHNYSFPSVFEGCSSVQDYITSVFASNDVGFRTFRQTIQLPPSDECVLGVLGTLHRAGHRQDLIGGKLKRPATQLVA